MSNKIDDYGAIQIKNYAVVIENPDSRPFEEEIEEWLDCDWQPFGPPLLDRKDRLIQVMVKYRPDSQDSQDSLL